MQFRGPVLVHRPSSYNILVARVGSFKNTKKSSILRKQIMSTIRLKNQFGWEEEIPEIKKKGEIFRDRSFAVFVRQGKTIKLLLSFTYDLPEFHFKAKVVQGAEMMPGLFKGGSGLVDMELKYNCEGLDNTWKVKDLDSVLRATSREDLVFSSRFHGKKVTYSLSTAFDVFKIGEEPMMLDKCLKLPE